MNEPVDFLDDDAHGPINGSDLPPRRPANVARRRLIAAFAATAIIAGAIGYEIGRNSGIGGALSSNKSTTLPAETTSQPAPTPDTEQDATAITQPTPESSESDPTPGAHVAQEYLLLLETIDIKGRAPMTGYDRDLFGQAWLDIDRNGCDTRNDILRRDLDDVTLRSGTDGCVVEAGQLDDPYTGTLIAFERGPQTSILVQIDHVVALADAWAKGAQQWTAEKRATFANDPTNLLAVDGPANQQKGAGDAATWLPPNRSHWCSYAARIVVVKSEYGIWTTPAEHRRLEELLLNCE